MWRWLVLRTDAELAIGRQRLTLRSQFFQDIRAGRKVSRLARCLAANQVARIAAKDEKLINTFIFEF